MLKLARRLLLLRHRWWPALLGLSKQSRSVISRRSLFVIVEKVPYDVANRAVHHRPLRGLQRKHVSFPLPSVTFCLGSRHPVHASCAANAAPLFFFCLNRLRALRIQILPVAADSGRLCRQRERGAVRLRAALVVPAALHPVLPPDVQGGCWREAQRRCGRGEGCQWQWPGSSDWHVRTLQLFFSRYRRPV